MSIKLNFCNSCICKTLVLMLFCNYGLFAQIIHKDILYGKWQLGSPEVSDAYAATYNFYKNGKFEFLTDQNYGLQRIYGLNGKYSVKRDTLILTVTEWREFVGGYPEFSEIFGGTGWVMSKSKLLTFNVKKAAKTYLKIGGPFINGDSQYISINEIKYYKIIE